MLSQRSAGLTLAALVLLPAMALAAPPLPSGQPFPVNVSQHGRHFDPKAAVFPDGGFVVVWTTGPLSGGRTVLHARFFAASGSPTSGEFRLTEPAVGSQTAEDVAADRDGSFLVAWREERSPGGPTDILARRFRRDGTPAGARIPVSVTGPFDRYGAHLAIGTGGQFAVAWSSDDFTTGPFTDALARRFRANGTPLGPEIPVDIGEPAHNEVVGPAFGHAHGVALQADGTLDVLVQDTTDFTFTFVQAYQPSGKTPQSPLLGLPGQPSIGAALAMVPDGRLIAVWENSDILGQRLSPQLSLQGFDFTVPKRQYYSESSPGVAALADGSFVTLWVSPTDPVPDFGSPYPVFVRVWNADGTPASRDFQFSAGTVLGSPAIAAGRGKGPVVVVWSQRRLPGGESDVYARLLTSR
jgi:hypothetical protein